MNKLKKSSLSLNKENRLAKSEYNQKIALLGMWMTCNYGAVLTSFALYRILEQLGMNVSLLDFSYTDRQRDQTTVFRRFLIQEQISIVHTPSLDNAYHLNDHFDTFIVGSDQVWNPEFLGHFFFLDFVKGEKRKIAYGPSMAQQFQPSEKYRKKTTQLLKRFDAVSVREQQMVEHLKQSFGQDSKWVLDPVFLPGHEFWTDLVKETTNKSKDKLVTYILDPSKTKRKLLLDASGKLNLPLLNMVDIQKANVDNAKKLDLPNTMREVTLYEWISNIAHCEAFITDSFHGVCFALIFNKPFFCINNSLRGSGRFFSLLKPIHLANRILSEQTESLPENIPLQIDYDAINNIIQTSINHSLQWLQDALSQKRTQELEDYNRKYEKKLTRRPPSCWVLSGRKLKRLAADLARRITLKLKLKRRNQH